MAWTNEQLAAISGRNKNFLVAAAAGSGKTAVLVERIIQRLMDKERPIDITQLLVMTFTNAAAAEMRERIGNALRKALEKDPQSSYLRRQLVLIHSASISTFHAFCQSVIRQYFHQIDLDPKFRLASEQEIGLLRYETMEKLFEEKYAAEDEAFLSFVERYGSERNDEQLYELLMHIYTFSSCQPFPEQWLDGLVEPFNIDKESTLDRTEWARLLTDSIRFELEKAKMYCEELLDIAGKTGVGEYEAVYQSDYELAAGLIELLNQPWSDIGEGFKAAVYAKMPRGVELDDELKAVLNKKRDAVKKIINNIKTKYFTMTEQEYIEDMVGLAPVIRTVCDLVKEFRAMLAAEKHQKSIVDFNDLEQFCLQVLNAGEAGELIPSAAALNFQNRYEEVMIDEYQDTNGVQEAILSLVIRPGKQANLFCVGDVKQSIYRFRLAEPELFMDKYKSYPENNDGTCERILLGKNFRSRPEILSAVNFLFEQLLDSAVAELDYGESEMLYPGMPYPSESSQCLTKDIELMIVDADNKTVAAETEITDGDDKKAIVSESDEAENTDEEKGFVLEAEWIAQRINRLLEERREIFDKEINGFRSLEWRDIVVLLRSPKSKSDILLEVLQKNNIPAYAAVGGSYFTASEIQTILSLLNIIDNPHQDIPLAAVLYSPIVGLSVTELAQIRLSEPEDDLWMALNAYCGEKEAVIKGFIDRLSEWRELARYKSVPELIWQLFMDTGYYDYVGGIEGGQLRQANLRMLYDRAADYEKTNYRGLFRFLRFIDKLNEADTDLSIAKTLSENDNVVNIMSIHKSKGLEFPVVILADMGKKFNFSDASAEILLHKKLGLGPNVVDIEHNFSYPSIARRGIACKIQQENRAEELRVLYVAMTRAREKLIMTGSLKNLCSNLQSWSYAAGQTEKCLPRHLIAGANSYLEWLCPALMRHPDGKILIELSGSMADSVNIESDKALKWQINIIPASKILTKNELVGESSSELFERLRNMSELPEQVKNHVPWVWQSLEYHYPECSLMKVPAKATVTELKARFSLLEDDEAVPVQQLINNYQQRQPSFMKAQHKLAANEYGTLMHSVMQYLDFADDISAKGIARQLEKLAMLEKIRAEHIKLIPVSALAKFLGSKLGKRMIAADKIWRELPFSLTMSAKRFYPEVKNDEADIFIQGVIDVLFEDEQGVVLLDYKTDRNTEPGRLQEKYAVQLAVYSEAVERIMHKKVAEKYLYLFHDGSIIKLENEVLTTN